MLSQPTDELGMAPRKSRATLVAIVAVPIVLSIGAAVFLLLLPRGLQAWVNQVQRPGFTLLYSVETESEYLAIFRVGKDRMAFCQKSLKKGDTISGGKTDFLDSDGNSLFDQARADQQEILRQEGYIHSGQDGIVYPIKSNYVGNIRVTHRRKIFAATEPIESPSDNWPLVIDVTISWLAAP
jgi:hypothetical protein